MGLETNREIILGPVPDECINVPSVLFMLRLLTASQTGDLLFSLESVVYKEPHNGNTHTHKHTQKVLTVTQIIRHTRKTSTNTLKVEKCLELILKCVTVTPDAL